MSSTAYASAEDPTVSFSFTEKSIRLGFIRKVYSILTVQLLIAIGFVAVFIFEKCVNNFVRTHTELIMIAFVIEIAVLISMACCSSARRTAPCNYICLFLFTCASSFLVGVVAAQYEVAEVLMAMGMTAAITFGLTLYAFQTKRDFTVCGGMLFILLIVLLITGIFAAIFRARILQTFISGFGALLMSFYIVYDTQLMIGGSHKYSISPEEYVFAALTLYIDIINLFLYILQLIGRRQ